MNGKTNGNRKVSLKGTIFNVIGSRYIFTILFIKDFFFYQPIQNFDQNEKQY